MKAVVLAVGILATGFHCAGPAFACDGGRLDAAMQAALPAKPGKTFDVGKQESTEGGVWDIYFADDGKTPALVVRNDYGESGLLRTRMTITAPDAFAITVMTSTYSAPNYVAGARTIREETDIYAYCGGKLALPSEEMDLDLTPYKTAAAEAMKTFDAPEIAAYVADLKR